MMRRIDPPFCNPAGNPAWRLLIQRMAYNKFLSLKVLIVINALLVAIPLIFGVIYATYEVHKASAFGMALNSQVFQQTKVMRIALQKAGDLERKARLFMLLSDPALRQPYELESYEAVRTAFKQALNELLQSPIDNKTALLINELAEKEKLIYQLIVAADQNNPDLVVDGAFQGLRESSNLLAQEFENYVEQQSATLLKQSDTLGGSLVSRGLLLLIVSMLFIGVVLKIFSRSVRELHATISRLASGNLAEPVSIAGPSEFHDLADSLEALRQHLASLPQSADPGRQAPSLSEEI